MNMDNIGILIAVWVTWSLSCFFAGMRIESRMDKAEKRKRDGDWLRRNPPPNHPICTSKVWHPGFHEPTKPKTDAEYKAELRLIAGTPITQEDFDKMRHDILRRDYDD